jgi:hypothetical protein
MAVSSNTINFDSIDFPFTPIEVYFAVRRPDGEYNVGRGLATSSTQLSAYPESGFDVFFVDQDQGKELVISLGFTGPAALNFRNKDERTCFLPDTNEFGVIDHPPVIDFPESACQGAGRWVLRPASTTYLDARYPQSQFPDAKGDVREGGDAFQEGDLARWVGDNFADASIRNESGLMVAGDDPLVDYYDHYYTGSHADPMRTSLRGQLSGTATASVGSRTQLTDSTKNWWAAVVRRRAAAHRDGHGERRRAPTACRTRPRPAAPATACGPTSASSASTLTSGSRPKC